jgi:hypothetical protein
MADQFVLSELKNSLGTLKDSTSIIGMLAHSELKSTGCSSNSAVEMKNRRKTKPPR